MATQKKEKEKLTRNWATIVYPESAPQDWRQILSEQHIDCYISPLHDRDKNPTGEDKKPHFHIILCYSGNKSQTQVKDDCQLFGGVGCEPVKSIRSYCRYLCHLDNPDKALYKTTDVVTIGGLDYDEICASCSDRLIELKNMLRFIEENDIREFCDFAIICAEDYQDWFKLIIEYYTLFLTNYIKSRRNKLKEKY